MSLLESSTIPSSELIYDWCQKGFVRYECSNDKESREARINLYTHLNSLTIPDAPLSQMLPMHVKIKIESALNTIASKSTNFYHNFPIQSFILINEKLIDLPDDPKNPSMQTITAIKKVYEEFRKLYVIEEPDNKEMWFKERTNLYRAQSTRFGKNDPTTPTYRLPSTHAVTTLRHGFEDNRPIRNSCRWCTWATRGCQTLWKKLFKQ